MNAFIDLRSEGLEKAATACQTASENAQIDAEAITLLAPIPFPRRNVFCVGRNYHEHAKRPVNTMEKENIDIRNKANEALSKIFYSGLRQKGKF